MSVPLDYIVKTFTDIANIIMTENIDNLLGELKIQFHASNKKLQSHQYDIFEIPEDISAIQNTYSSVENHSEELVQDIRERLEIIERNEMVLVLLNYKMYEIRYESRSKIAQLSQEKQKLETEGVTSETASQTAFKIVEIQNNIGKCEERYQQQHTFIKEQILLAQAGYESSIDILDHSLEQLKKNLDYLALLVEAQKVHFSSQRDTDEKIELLALEKALDHFTELQTSGWKTATNITTPEAKGLTITEDGMLITQSGRLITYSEAREQNLLENMRISDFIKLSPMVKNEKEGESSTRSESDDGSMSSKKSRLASEDVTYLIEHLGTPLTLALTEITAVQPRDPIHYLGHWLFKYLYNREVSDLERIEMDQLTEERTRLAREKWHKFVEEEARAAVFDMVARAEEEAIQEELLRIERELLEHQQEEELLDNEARDTFGTYGGNSGLKL
ncbi:uncharacterized protein [Leptinotarsa decemlineata]|uniref:uncharacterized protein n=1 Tax=Leptinotarsa decemlineata TaxID=7539 RepID=UPI003D308979